MFYTCFLSDEHTYCERKALLDRDGGSYIGLQCFIGAFISASVIFAIMARLAGQPNLKQKF